MKKTLEVVVVVAALVLGAFILRQWRARLELSEHPPASSPAARPGTDAEGPLTGATGARRAGGVAALPMIKLSSPPRSSRRAAAVPAPAKP